MTVDDSMQCTGTKVNIEMMHLKGVQTEVRQMIDAHALWLCNIQLVHSLETFHRKIISIIKFNVR